MLLSGACFLLIGLEVKPRVALPHPVLRTLRLLFAAFPFAGALASLLFIKAYPLDRPTPNNPYLLSRRGESML